MSETASGLFRVVVLTAATSMFAVVWRADQQTQQQFLIARQEAAEQTRQLLLTGQSDEHSVALNESSPHSFVTGHHERTAIDSDVPVELPVSYVARVEIEMELPREITAGRYQVVDQDGHVQTIRIHSSTTTAQDQDIYLLDLPDGSRRVFIRVPQVDEPMTAALPDVSR